VLQNSSGAVLVSWLGPNGIVQSAGSQIVTAADYSNSTVTPSTIVSWTLPPTVSAKTYSYSCRGIWESTGVSLVGLVLGVDISAAPTQITAGGEIEGALSGTNATGYISNVTTGNQTVITGGAAGVTSTPYLFEIYGTIEAAPTAGSTFSITGASTSGTTATVVVKRGFGCTLQ
jgi:hypothetical protein